MSGVGSPTVWAAALETIVPWILQSRTPVKRRVKPFGPVIVKS